jgi:chromosome partitioning protein
VIFLSNEKGGCGKTTTAVSLASSLARRGNRTLLIDGDPHGSAGLQLPSIAPALFSLLDIVTNTAAFHMAVEPTAFSNLYIMRSDERLKLVDMELSADGVDELAKRLAAIDLDNFDYVVIDSQPSASRLREALSIMADSMVIPLFSEAVSIKGLVTQMQNVQKWKAKRKELLGLDSQLIGVTITNYIHGHATQRSTLPELESALEAIGVKLLAVIPQSGAVGTAADNGVPIPWTGRLKSYAIYRAFEKLANAVDNYTPAESLPTVTAQTEFEEDMQL